MIVSLFWSSNYYWNVLHQRHLLVIIIIILPIIKLYRGHLMHYLTRHDSLSSHHRDLKRMVHGDIYLFGCDKLNNTQITMSIVPTILYSLKKELRTGFCKLVSCIILEFGCIIINLFTVLIIGEMESETKFVLDPAMAHVTVFDWHSPTFNYWSARPLSLY